jgi:hypothetical protein
VTLSGAVLLRLAQPNLTPLLCRGGRASCLTALVEMFDDLAHVGLALLFAGGRADRVEGVGRLDEDGIVDDDLGVGPAGRETGMARLVLQRTCQMNGMGEGRE